MVAFLDLLVRSGLILTLLFGFTLALVLPLVLLAALFARSAGPLKSADLRLGKILVGLPAAGLALGLVLGIGGCALDNAHEKWTRERDLERVAINARPLIEAIERFRSVEGRVPRQLDELVPAYLPEVPGTGLERWERFTYFERGPDRFDVDVGIPIGWMDMEHNRRFQYAPDPSRDAALGATLRQADWVYVPDVPE